jgi:divinyl protochlorophyllide a 8-vinyl-reductase
VSAASLSGLTGAPVARIGPNAITRMAEALVARYDRATARAVFVDAGLAGLFDQPPEDMVDETLVARLHHHVHGAFAPASARALARDAGRRTGDYLLAHRIPRFAQMVLKRLPAALAARILTRAIARHAWTFAGSGTFSMTWRPHLVLAITHSPMCRGLKTDHPVCEFYTAVFQRIFEVLVSRHTRVREIECEAAGGRACRFEIRWSKRADT